MTFLEERIVQGSDDVIHDASIKSGHGEREREGLVDRVDEVGVVWESGGDSRPGVVPLEQGQKSKDELDQVYNPEKKEAKMNLFVRYERVIEGILSDLVRDPPVLVYHQSFLLHSLSPKQHHIRQSNCIERVSWYQDPWRNLLPLHPLV